MPKRSWREFDDSLSTFEVDYSSNQSQPKADRKVRVQSTRGGKAGKTVTVISGLGITNNESKKLLKRLKASCGTGGTIKIDALELQGDQVSIVLDFLEKEGFRPKRSGG